MRLALVFISAVALAGPARAQEFGAFGMGGQLWDAGSAYHPGFGISLGLLTARNDSSTRFGIRASYDLVAVGRDNTPVAFPTLDQRIGGDVAFDVIDGPSESHNPNLATIRFVALAPVSRITRVEFSVGAAREEGRNGKGSSGLVGIGVARRYEGDRPIWATFTYEQRFNKTQTTAVFGQPSRLLRGSFRAGVFIEAGSRPTR